MPTLNWIQETAWDRYSERGSSDSGKKIDPTYSCRVCGNVFDSISERDQHEVNHPVLNPTIFIDGKEVCGDSVDINSLLTSSDLYLRNVEFLTINGVDCQGESELFTKMTVENSAFLDVRYGNGNIERRVRINICIADPEEIKAVDRAFIQCFEVGGVNDPAIVAFAERIRELNTVRSYSDGLVRYLQGLMAKDNRSEMFSFEKFVERFNQATNSLRNYETGLSLAISAVVNFNRNDFSSISRSGIPLLDNAIEFFKGGDLLEFSSVGKSQLLPVDYATECVLSKLLAIYKDGILEELEDEIKAFSPQYLSLQDKMKFDYICWRKSVQVGNSKAEKLYHRRLRLDDAFSGLVENK